MLVSSGYGISVIPHAPSSHVYPNVCYIPIRRDPSDRERNAAHTLYDLVMAYPKANSNPLLPVYVELIRSVLEGERE